MRPHWPLITATVLISPIASVAAWCLASGTLAASALPAPTDPSRDTSRAAEQWLDQPVSLRTPDGMRWYTRWELGARVSPAAAEGATRSPGRPFAVEVDRRLLRSILEDVRSEVDRARTVGVVDVAQRTVRPHEDGLTLDMGGSVERVARALVTDATDVELPVGLDPVPLDGRVPTGLALTQVLARFETEFRRHGKYHGRSRNVELAAAKMHGAIVPAGGSLSFNDRVGPRTRQAGFRRAPVIVGGELADGMGGGVCQVASTMHAAALMAGLEIPVQRPHSRPSSYIPMGMDAMVSWPSSDLVVKNPFSFPIAVSATTRDGRLEVEILGAEQPRQIQIERQVLSRSGFHRKVVIDPSLPAGARDVSQRGIPGARVRRTRTIHEADGSARTEVVELRYPPTHEITRVGGFAAGPPSTLAGRQIASR